MRDKINKCINRSYNEEGEFSRVKAIEELEGLFDSEILSFISFLRENYSTEQWSNDWKEWVSVKYGKYRCIKTDNNYEFKEILNIWKQR